MESTHSVDHLVGVVVQYAGGFEMCSVVMSSSQCVDVVLAALWGARRAEGVMEDVARAVVGLYGAISGHMA